MDKDWLVDKLAELEKLKVEMQKEIKERRDQWGKLKDEADSSRLVIEDLGQMLRFNEPIIDHFNKARMELLLNIDPPLGGIQSKTYQNDKENNQLLINQRETFQSHRNLSTENLTRS